jgi:phage FluMu protein Com
VLNTEARRFELSQPLDYTEEYVKHVKPEINRRLKKIISSFFGCGLLLIVASLGLDFFNLPDKLILIIFIPCASFFLHHVLSLRDVKCPHCKKPLFILYGIAKVPIISSSYVSSRCPHCGVKLR